MKKQCFKCKKYKTERSFHKDKYKKDGLRSRCKLCVAKYRKHNPKKVKESQIKNKYGCSIKQYNKIFFQQNGKCAICGKAETATHYKTNKIMKLSIDHNHNTKQIRGLLCKKCNLGLSNFGENVSLLHSAIKYLNKFNNKNN